mgnify:CR=1 FL=1
MYVDKHNALRRERNFMLEHPDDNPTSNQFERLLMSIKNIVHIHPLKSCPHSLWRF